MVAIGGLGGSGTRLVAQLLQKAGFFLGENLNVSLDDLTFTRMFKNPLWFQNHQTSDWVNRLNIYTKILNNQSLTPSEAWHYYRAMAQNQLEPTTLPQRISLTQKALFAQPHHHRLLGWKEPNTQFYARKLLNQIPDLKYIHVVRHGLYMAHSGNKQQLHNWGFLHDIHAKEGQNSNDLAQLQLDFWIATTRTALALQTDFKNRVLVLLLDNLISNPSKQIAELFNFLELKLEPGALEELSRLPQKKANNALQHIDYKKFGAQQLDAVRQMGFKI